MATGLESAANSIVLEAVNQYILPMIVTAVGSLATWAITEGCRWLRSKSTLAQLLLTQERENVLKQYANNAILFAEEEGKRHLSEKGLPMPSKDKLELAQEKMRSDVFNNPKLPNLDMKTVFEFLQSAQPSSLPALTTKDSQEVKDLFNWDGNDKSDSF